MTHKKAIQSLNEEEANLLKQVIEGSNRVGAKKIWQRDIHPSRHAVTTREAIQKLVDLALVTKEPGNPDGYTDEPDFWLHITVKAAGAVGLYWHECDEWDMRPDVRVNGLFCRDVEDVIYAIRKG